MNCCDYNCTQGRECPARVAKVGQRTHTKAPLPPSPWRRQLRTLAYWMLMAILGTIWIGFILGVTHAQTL